MPTEEDLQVVIRAVDQAGPFLQALTEAITAFGEQMMDTMKHFGILTRRLHHRGRAGRWQQHLKLGMIASGYVKTRHGWQAPPRRRRLRVEPYVGVGYLRGAMEAVNVADVWQKTMKRLMEQELPK